MAVTDGSCHVCGLWASFFILLARAFHQLSRWLMFVTILVNLTIKIVPYSRMVLIKMKERESTTNQYSWQWARCTRLVWTSVALVTSTDALGIEERKREKERRRCAQGLERATKWPSWHYREDYIHSIWFIAWCISAFVEWHTFHPLRSGTVFGS